MRKLASMVIGISVVSAALVLVPSLASAQAQDQRPIVYSVKFVCGLQAIIPTRPPTEPVLRQNVVRLCDSLGSIRVPRPRR